MRAARPRWGSDGHPLATRFTIALATGRHPETIYRRCRPVACDTRTRALLYDVDEVAATLDRPSGKRDLTLSKDE